MTNPILEQSVVPHRIEGGRFVCCGKVPPAPLKQTAQPPTCDGFEKPAKVSVKCGYQMLPPKETSLPSYGFARTL